MKKSIRFLSIILCLLIAAISMTACGGPKENNKTSAQQDVDTSWQAPTEGSGGIALPISKELLEYEYSVYEVAAMPYKDTFLISPELQKRTNIKLNINPSPVDGFGQKIEIQLTAGDYPDLIGGVPDHLTNRSGAQGKFLNVLEYLDDMPNLKRVMEAYPGLKHNKFSQDTMYTLPLLINDERADRNYFRYVYMYRSDIAEKHHLKVPETTEALYDFLKELKRLYPESHPWTDRHGLGSFLSRVGEAWGLSFNGGNFFLYDHNTETFKLLYEDHRFREMLQFLLKLYNEGLLDQELLILPNVQQWQERMVSGTSFMTYDWFNRTEQFTVAGREAGKTNGNPDYTISPMLPPKSPYGEQVVTPGDLWQNTIAVSSKVKNPREVMKFLDYWLYSKDGAILNYIGVDGVTFKWVDEAKTKWDYIGDGEYEKLDEVNCKKKYGMIMDLTSGVKPQFYGIMPAVEYTDQIQKTIELYKGHTLDPVPRMIFNEDEDFQLENYGPADDLQRQFLAKLFIGEQTLDDMDEFIQELKRLGIEEKLKLYNDNWARRK